MTPDHSSDSSRETTNSERPEQPDGEPRLALSGQSSELPIAGLLLIAGVLGALFAGFAALLFTYEGRLFNDITLSNTEFNRILLYTVITAAFGVALFIISTWFRNGAGQAAALVGAILTSLLVLEQPNFFPNFEFFFYDPVLTIAFVAFLSRPRDRIESERREAEAETPERYQSWFHRLFSLGESEHVLLVAAGTSVAIFFAIYFLTRLYNPFIAEDYLNPLSYMGNLSYFGTLLIFFELAILGKWVTKYRQRWRDVEVCFDTDESPRSYEEFLDELHECMTDPKFVFVLFLPLWHFFSSHTHFVRMVPELSFTALFVFLGLTIVYLFAVHVLAVKDVLDFEFDNIYSAAQQIEPLTKFTVNTAFWWFAVISAFVVFGFFDELSSGLLNALGPIVTWLWPLVVIGFAVVAVPIWLIHNSLSEAKSDLLADIHARQNELIDEWKADGESGNLTEKLDGATLAYESAARIRTSPYDVTGLVKVLLSSLLPVGQLILNVLNVTV